MLSELQSVFEKKFSKQKIQLKKIESSCCNFISKEVFHLDYIVAKFFNQIKVGDYLCSVDVIHFATTQNELILAELTSFKTYAEKTGKNTDQDCLDYVRKELLDNKCRNKYIHSIFTLLKIIDYFGIDKKFYSYFLDPEQLSLKNFLVIDLTSEQYIFIEISCMDKLVKHKKNRIEGELNILNCEEFEKRLVA